jgi:hypothetical protein
MPSNVRIPPVAMTIAIGVMADNGVLRMSRNEFELRMHQGGCNSRDVVEALRALQRRGWLLSEKPDVVLSEAALSTRPPKRKPATTKARRIPNLFA